MRKTTTAAAYANELGVSVNKVRGWLESGELVGLNVATNSNGNRKRYVIRISEIEKFERRRQSAVSVQPPNQPRRRRLMKVEKFI
jgi:hypothetical protein